MVAGSVDTGFCTQAAACPSKGPAVRFRHVCVRRRGLRTTLSAAESTLLSDRFLMWPKESK